MPAVNPRLFSIADLDVPIVQAPMAGGPSTPELAAAASMTGGLGFLAAGYRTAAAMRTEIATYRELSGRPFGVNVFVPERVPSDPAAVASYADALAPLARELGVGVPVPAPAGDDDYPAKVRALIDEPVPVVSFTFGLPEPSTVTALREAGSAVVLSVTSPAEASEAIALAPDALVVQGTEAGGHRAQFDQKAQPFDATALELLASVRRLTSIPLIAAGGVAGRDDVRRLLAAGASAVQVGTLLITSHEAGTKPAHRAALLDGVRTRTTVTRVFSGRPARALRNRFIERMEHAEAAGYPEIHYLTTGLRAAAGDADGMNLWSGTGFAGCRDAPASEIIRALAP